MEKVIEIDGNLLICAKCESVLEYIGDVDGIITDPPYGNTQNNWDCEIDIAGIWEKLWKINAENGVIILFGQNRFSCKMALSSEYFRYILVWEKVRASGFLNARRRPLVAHEDILVFYRKQPVFNPQMEEGVPYKTTYPLGSGLTSSYGKFERKGTVLENEGVRFPRSVIRFSNQNYKSQHPTAKPPVNDVVSEYIYE